MSCQEKANQQHEPLPRCFCASGRLNGVWSATVSSPWLQRQGWGVVCVAGVKDRWSSRNVAVVTASKARALCAKQKPLKIQWEFITWWNRCSWNLIKHRNTVQIVLRWLWAANTRICTAWGGQGRNVLGMDSVAVDWEPSARPHKIAVSRVWLCLQVWRRFSVGTRGVRHLPPKQNVRSSRKTRKSRKVIS